MTVKSVFIACLIICLFTLVGCADVADDWVGTWYVESLNGHVYFPDEVIFYSDGTVEWISTISTEGVRLGTFSVTQIGTYTVSGFNYTIAFTASELAGEWLPINTVYAGTWSRRGNALILNMSSGAVWVLRVRYPIG